MAEGTRNKIVVRIRMTVFTVNSFMSEKKIGPDESHWKKWKWKKELLNKDYIVA
jgi:hypothetical protein